MTIDYIIGLGVDIGVVAEVFRVIDDGLKMTKVISNPWVHF